MTAPTITLTGVQPTGELHLGNYAGAIRPLAELAAQPSRETYVFVADVHVSANGRRANAKSILDVLALGAEGGAELRIDASGEDAVAAAEHLVLLVPELV